RVSRYAARHHGRSAQQNLQGQSAGPRAQGRAPGVAQAPLPRRARRALRDVRHRARGDRRVPRAERRGQDHHAQDAGGPAAPDEPTLGLDVTAQEAIRRFLTQYRDRHGATVLLTSHYMQDVTALASRVLIINRGRLLYDGALAALVARIAHTKRIELMLADGVS